MKITAFVVLASLLASVAAYGADICIERGKNAGAVNLLKAEITANGRHLCSIAGGERKCINVKPGKYTIHAQSSSPSNSTDKSRKTWNSQNLSIFVAPEGKVTITLEPLSFGVEYIGQWLLKESMPD